MFQEFDSAWEEHRSETEEIRALDHERVLVLSIEHFRGRDGIEIRQPCGAIYTLREGKVIRMQSFWERETAFRAAGVSQ
jgi:ketosteroid isomerase-like protein